MTSLIIITVSTLLLAAYLFDLTSAKTKIPSVILLLLLGWVLKIVVNFLDIEIPDLTPTLPILGTIGLILIVLEGALELELDRSKKRVFNKSLVSAVLPMVIISLGLAYVFKLFGLFSFRDGLMNAIPLSVISSAIAIPTAVNLSPKLKEFVTYESSLSDILGVLFFNFITLNYIYNWDSFGHFGLHLLIILVGSFVATIILTFLLSKIDHHIKFAPIILLIILIYTISKIYHLPGLIFILLFGLFMNNFTLFKNIKIFKRLDFSVLEKESQSFKELTSEATFLIRALFFLVFGFLIETSELLNTETLFWAIGIIIGVLIIRAIFLKLINLPLRPLLYIAPRGLITILLFLEIQPVNKINFVNKPLIIQIIVLSVIVMMIGMIITSDDNEEKSPLIKKDENNDNEVFEHKLVVKDPDQNLIDENEPEQ